MAPGAKLQQSRISKQNATTGQKRPEDTSGVVTPLKNPAKPLGKSAPADGRAPVSPWLHKGPLKATQGLNPWTWARMTGPQGEWRDDDDWELFDRTGKMVARVRQEGGGYWVARPRITPEPPIESFDAAVPGASRSPATLTCSWQRSRRGGNVLIDILG